MVPAVKKWLPCISSPYIIWLIECCIHWLKICCHVFFVMNDNLIFALFMQATKKSMHTCVTDWGITWQAMLLQLPVWRGIRISTWRLWNPVAGRWRRLLRLQQRGLRPRFTCGTGQVNSGCHSRVICQDLNPWHLQLVAPLKASTFEMRMTILSQFMPCKRLWYFMACTNQLIQYNILND